MFSRKLTNLEIKPKSLTLSCCSCLSAQNASPEEHCYSKENGTEKAENSSLFQTEKVKKDKKDKRNKDNGNVRNRDKEGNCH